jgi:hypothetical protein
MHENKNLPRENELAFPALEVTGQAVDKHSATGRSWPSKRLPSNYLVRTGDTPWPAV